MIATTTSSSINVNPFFIIGLTTLGLPCLLARRLFTGVEAAIGGGFDVPVQLSDNYGL